jgi:hypothetical protein
MQSLTQLGLQRNKLSGSLTNMSSVCVWDIASNVPCLLNLTFMFFFLTGPIPESIGQLQSLTGLYLYENELSGELINIFGTSPVMSLVYVTSNFLRYLFCIYRAYP